MVGEVPRKSAWGNVCAGRRRPKQPALLSEVFVAGLTPGGVSEATKALPLDYDQLYDAYIHL